MKIVCDSCQAKYSIADEKVRGKVFKIRCKKCSNIIVVRGGGEGEQPQQSFDQKETRVFDYSGYDDPAAAAAAANEAVWHLVIDQEQVGPMSANDVRARFARGEVDAETYTWREGFADWLPLAQVEGFTDLGSAAAAPAAGDDAAAGLFGGPAVDDAAHRNDPGDLFAAAGGDADEPSEQAGADLFGAPAPAEVGGGSMADSLFGAAPRGGNGAAAPADAGEQQLRGQRNENSVLFSLNNLAALATGDRPAPSPSSSSSSSPSSSPGMAAGMAQHGGGEGSGLIDIRSMAGAYLGAKTGNAGAAKMEDDLPVFSTASFDAAPAVLLPTGAPSQANNKVLYALFGVIAVLLIAAVILLFVVFKSKGGEKTVVVKESGGETDQGGGSVGKPTGGDGDQSGQPSNGTGGDTGKPTGDDSGNPQGATPGGDDKPKPDPKPDKPKPDPKPDTGHHSGHDPKPDPKPRPDPKPDPKPDPGGKCLDEVACLLADNPPACCKKYKGGNSGDSSKPKPDPKPDSNLPEKLERADVTSGISGVRDRVLSCGDKSDKKGQVTVAVSVSGSGSVSSVSVVSSPDSALGSCVASAVKKAHFPKTQTGGKFNYPFVIR